MYKLSVALLFLFTFSCLVTAGNKVANKAEFEVTILRNATCRDGSTIGRLLLNDIEVGLTREFPRRNNESNISRIPPGSYAATIRADGRLGWRIKLENVRDRQNVRLHVGNYQRQLRGSVHVGDSVTHEGQKCFLKNGRKTLSEISAQMAKISEKVGVNQSIPVNIRVTIDTDIELH